jgi:hypothetical protein
MDCFGVIDFETEKPILFAPQLDKVLEIWMTIYTAEDLKAKYDIEVRKIETL